MSNPLLFTIEVNDKGTPVVKRFQGEVKDGFDSASKSAKGLTSELYQMAAAYVGFQSVKGVFLAITNEGRQLETSIAQLGAVAGKSGDDFKMMASEIKTAVLGISKMTAFSANDMVRGMQEIVQGGKTEAEALKMVVPAMKLATISGQDLTMMTDLLTGSMNSFRLGIYDVTHATDVMASATDKSKLDYQKMAYAMHFVGGAALTYNQNLEESLTVMAKFSDMMMTGEQIGTTYRDFLNTLAQRNTALSKTLEKLKIDYSEVNPYTHQMSEILERLAKSNISGQQAINIWGQFGSQIYGAIKNIRQFGSEWHEMTNSFKNDTGVMNDKFSNFEDTLNFQWQKAMNNMKSSWNTVYDDIRPKIISWMELLGKLGNWADMALGGGTETEKIRKKIKDLESDWQTYGEKLAELNKKELQMEKDATAQEQKSRGYKIAKNAIKQEEIELAKKYHIEERQNLVQQLQEMEISKKAAEQQAYLNEMLGKSKNKTTPEGDGIDTKANKAAEKATKQYDNLIDQVDRFLQKQTELGKLTEPYDTFIQKLEEAGDKTDRIAKLQEAEARAMLDYFQDVNDKYDEITRERLEKQQQASEEAARDEAAYQQSVIDQFNQQQAQKAMALTQAFAMPVVDVFANQLVNGFDNAGEAFEQMAKQMLIQLIEVTAQALILKGIMTALGVEPAAQAGQMGGGLLGMVFSLFHQGGYIPKAHTGLYVNNGLRNDEVPIIAQRGEGIINKQNTERIGGKQAIDRINRGESVGGTQVLYQISGNITVVANDPIDFMNQLNRMAEKKQYRIPEKAVRKGRVR